MPAVPIPSMWSSRRTATTALTLATITLLSACGSSSHDPQTPPGTAVAATTAPSATASTTTSTTTSTTPLPGTGKPRVTIGDKNFTEQFILGELYGQALEAQGYNVVLNRNIGPPEVTIQALESGRLGMYPEYMRVWNQTIAGEQRSFRTRGGAYRAAQRYAVDHGLELLTPTPFGNTDAIAVLRGYADENHLRSLTDLRRVAPTMTLGGPVQFQQSSTGLPAIEQAYGFVPESFKPLDVGSQYQALDTGAVQGADINTTDGELTSGNYTLLRDPLHTLGWGNVVPVVSVKVMDAEGPVFTETIERVSRLLTTPVMRRLNAAVDISNQDPAVVAKQFLQANGIPAAAVS